MFDPKAVEEVARVLADDMHGDGKGNHWHCWENGGCWHWNTGRFHKQARAAIGAYLSATKTAAAR